MNIDGTTMSEEHEPSNMMHEEKKKPTQFSLVTENRSIDT